MNVDAIAAEYGLPTTLRLRPLTWRALAYDAALDAYQRIMHARTPMEISMLGSAASPAIRALSEQLGPLPWTQHHVSALLRKHFAIPGLYHYLRRSSALPEVPSR